MPTEKQLRQDIKDMGFEVYRRYHDMKARKSIDRVFITLEAWVNDTNNQADIIKSLVKLKALCQKIVG